MAWLSGLVRVTAVLILTSSGSYCQDITSCVMDTTSKCECTTNKGKIDLSGLGTKTYYEVKDSAGGQTFYWNPCKNFQMDSKDVGAMQETNSKLYYEIGTHQMAYADTYNGYARFFMYSSDYMRTTYVQCQCQSGFSLTYQNESPTMTYNFILKSDYCCPGYVPPNITVTVSVSIGWILVIVFFLVLILYLIVGTIYSVAIKKAQGVERIPNVGFWTSLPGLIRVIVFLLCAIGWVLE